MTVSSSGDLIIATGRMRAVVLEIRVFFNVLGSVRVPLSNLDLLAIDSYSTCGDAGDASVLRCIQ